MLLLSRKSGQSIVINDDIVVTVVAVDRNRVRIGVRAPGYVPIYRQEIVERMVERGRDRTARLSAAPRRPSRPRSEAIDGKSIRTASGCTLAAARAVEVDVLPAAFLHLPDAGLFVGAE